MKEKSLAEYVEERYKEIMNYFEGEEGEIASLILYHIPDMRRGLLSEDPYDREMFRGMIYIAKKYREKGREEDLIYEALSMFYNSLDEKETLRDLYIDKSSLLDSIMSVYFDVIEDFKEYYVDEKNRHLRNSLISFILSYFDILYRDSTNNPFYYGKLVRDIVYSLNKQAKIINKKIGIPFSEYLEKLYRENINILDFIKSEIEYKRYKEANRKRRVEVRCDIID